MTTMLRDKENVKVRTNHTCFLCDRPARKGTLCYSQTNADGNSVWTVHAHMKCWRYLGTYQAVMDIDFWDDEIDIDQYDFALWLDRINE